MSRSPGPAYGWLAELPVLVVSLAAFLALTFHQVALPGLHTDEALEVLPAMQLLRGQPVECFKDVCIDLFGLRLPVMIYEYIATVNTYMAIPFFAVLGINVTALRTMAICQSAVAIVFLYLLARELFNRRVAMVAVLLIAVSPSFVFWSRQGVFVTSVTIPIALAATWAWLRWWRGSKSRYLFVGSFLFGLGLSAKFLFLWLIAGLGGAFLILNLDRIALCIRTRSLAPLGLRLRWRDAAIGGLLFLLGLLPLIVFNVKTMSTIHYVLNNVSSSSYYNVDNARVGVNLRERVKQLRSVLNGETFWYLSINPYASWRYPSVFLAASRHPALFHICHQEAGMGWRAVGLGHRCGGGRAQLRGPALPAHKRTPVVRMAASSRPGCHDGDEHSAPERKTGAGLGQAVPDRHRRVSVYCALCLSGVEVGPVAGVVQGIHSRP